MFIFGKKYKNKIKNLESKINDFENKINNIYNLIEQNIIYEIKKNETIEIGSINSIVKILHISTYNIKCGIADYEENLINGFQKTFNSYHKVIPINFNFYYNIKYLLPYINNIINLALKEKFSFIDIQYEYSFFLCQGIINEDDLKKIFTNLNPIYSKYLNNPIFKSLIVFDYLITNLLKNENKIIITWHSGFEHIPEEILNLNYKEIPVLRYFKNNNLKIVILNKNMINILKEKNIPVNNFLFYYHPVPKFFHDERNIILSNNLKSKYNILKNDKILATFGFIGEYKGILDVCKILKFLPDNYKYLIIGGKHERDNSNFFETLNKFIIDNKLENRVFITGYVNKEDIFSYVNLIDLSLLLYKVNSNFASGSINNIIAFNKPILCSNISYFVNLYNDYNCLEISNNIDNHKKIAEEIINLLNNKEKIKKLEINSKKFCEENNFEILAKKYNNIF